MRYLKTLLIGLAVVWAALTIIENIDQLAGIVRLQFGLVPFLPSDALSMPLWVLTVLVFAAAFVFAILFEVYAWYMYESTIRMQRRQIRALQDKLGAPRQKAPASREAGGPGE